MDSAATALPAFVALLLLSPWSLLGLAQGQFSAGEWPGGTFGARTSAPKPGARMEGSFGGWGVGGGGAQVRSRDVPGLCARWDVGHPAGATWRAGNFHRDDPLCVSEARSGRGFTAV
jgi:hypothetical protein